MTTSKPNRLLFASCNSQYYEQVLWPAILDRNASAFVWGGDAIYGDDFTKPAFFANDLVKEATPEGLKAEYEQQKQNPGYKALVDSQIQIWGVLDDHDYGTNDGDKAYQYRRESGILFACEFLQLGSACQRAQKGLGVYGVKVIDFARPEGQQVLTEEEAGIDPDVQASMPLGDQTVAVFLIDIRSNKTPYTQKMGPEEGDFLGEEQWKWFEQALSRSSAAVNIVVQGLQVHADRQGPAETWSRFPSSQQHMYQALLQSNVQAPVIISGDVHHAQLLRKDCHAGSAQQTLLEVTTSGMTHSWGSYPCARPHQSTLCERVWFQWIMTKTVELAQHLNGRLVWTEVIDLAGSEVTVDGKPGLQFTLDRNFAELELDFVEKSVSVQILGQDVGAKPLLHHKWSFEELSAAGQADGPWTCENYRGAPNPHLRIVGLVLPLLLGFLTLFSPLFILVLILFRLCRGGRSVKTKQS